MPPKLHGNPTCHRVAPISFQRQRCIIFESKGPVGYQNGYRKESSSATPIADDDLKPLQFFSWLCVHVCRAKLPRYDSNVDCLVQSQECYRLHHRAKLFSINKNPEAFAGLRGLSIQFQDHLTQRARSTAGLAVTAMLSGCRISLNYSMHQLYRHPDGEGIAP